jgi:hypothetical protein
VDLCPRGGEIRPQAGYWAVKPWFNGLSGFGPSLLTHIGATLVTPHTEALQTPWTRRPGPEFWDIPVQLNAGLVALESRTADSVVRRRTREPCTWCTPEFDHITGQVMACGGGFTR